MITTQGSTTVLRRRIGRAAATLVAVAVAVGIGAPVASAIEFAEVGASVSDSSGAPLRQAGAHPDVRFSFYVPQRDPSNPESGPKELPHRLQVELPPGLVGNATAAPTCAEPALKAGAGGQAAVCPVGAQVGIATLLFGAGEHGFFSVPVYNVVRPVGFPALFAFNVAGVVVKLSPSVRAGDYGITIDSGVISTGVSLAGADVTLWGVPADPAHDAERFGLHEGSEVPYAPASSQSPRLPFLSLPTSCSGMPEVTTARLDGWASIGQFATASFSADFNGVPFIATGCERLPFAPSIEVSPTSRQADSPTGLDVDLKVPQSEAPDGLATSHVRNVTVTLPQGMSVNASSVAGLGSCSEAQIGLGLEGGASCPQSSKVGSVEVDTPLIDHPLLGSVYLAKQGENKFGSLLAIYIAVEDPDTGIYLKLPGKVVTDPQTGQVTATFENNPQLPFEELHVSFFGGPGAPLVNPSTCGTYATAAQITPWSGTAPVDATSSYKVTTGPNGGPCPSGRFDPKLSAGTVNPVAGTQSPFVLSLSREDGTQLLGGLNLTLPEGLLGKLAGIPYCSDASLGAVSGNEGTGAAQIGSPSCPAASQVGTVSVGAGAGTSPFYVNTGKAYLAGPYKGAPLSLAFVTPAVAGPFDLGNVVVRAALQVDPVTTQITAVSDPLPTILHGIPLDLRDVSVNLDRPDFALNPTNCDPAQIAGQASSPAGASAVISSRFQVAGCEALGLQPKLALQFSGAPTRRGGHPKLTATLTTVAGDANLKRVQVTLPKTEFLENAHIKTVCTRVQYAANQCPAQSIYGYARAWTPLLDKPLEGPVYLRSSSNKLPDLVASLDGQIHIDLDGRISSFHSRIRNTFEMVPDAPVSKFVLTMQGGGKGLLVNNTNLCKAKPVASVEFNGQNGKVANTDPLVSVGGCGGKKAKQGKKKH